MKWFINLRIGIKLISSFILIAFMAGIVGIMGVVALQKILQKS